MGQGLRILRLIIRFVRQRQAFLQRVLHLHHLCIRFRTSDLKMTIALACRREREDCGKAVGTARDCLVAVGTEMDRVDRFAVPWNGAQATPAIDLPEPYGLVRAARYSPTTVPAQVDCVDTVEIEPPPCVAAE